MHNPLITLHMSEFKNINNIDIMNDSLSSITKVENYINLNPSFTRL